MDKETTTINDSVSEIDWNNVDESFTLSLRSAELIREGRARAAMARPAEDSVRVIKDESVAIFDCGASSTL